MNKHAGELAPILMSFEDKYEMEQWLNKNAEYLGSGSYRQVWRYGSVVVKVGRSMYDNGMICNESEFDAWQRYRKNKRIAAMFAPVLDAGPQFKWLIMEYVDGYRWHDKRFVDRMHKAGVRDLHIGNYLRVGRTFKCIDYQDLGLR